MIACLYGQAFAPFVEPVVRDMCAAAATVGGTIQPLTIETALSQSQRRAEVHRLYVLPFDLPPSAHESPATAIRALFPRAEVVTSFAVQDLCWDKLATEERLLARGLPVPETLLSTDPAEVMAFVGHHRFAILKERYACAGQGHVVVWIEDGRLVGDSGSQRYALDLVPSGRRQIDATRLVYPAPYYVQRLVVDIGPRNVTPGQLLRAYIVDNQIAFWTERYRDRYLRPADWIINASLGAKYRFVLAVSEEVMKIAMRTAEVIGMRIGVVDIIRTGSGAYVLEADTDSHHMMIDRQFKHIPDYREFFDLDRYIADTLLIEPESPAARRDESIA